MWKFVALLFAVHVNISGALTLPIRVALQTCSISDSLSISTAFSVSWTFPASSAIVSKPATANFQRAADSTSYWFAVLDTSMSVDTTVFASAITGQITITANTIAGLCVNKLTVNGVYATGTLPTFIDSPCSPTHAGYPCSASFVGTFLLYPPIYPVTIKFTTCDELLASSPEQFLLEFPSQTMATTITNVGDRSLSITQKVYLKSYLQSQTMKITAMGNEGWCLDSVTVEGRSTTFASKWLDTPCGSYAGTLPCAGSSSFTFTLGSPTTMPTLKPTAAPSIAPSSSKPSAKPTTVPTTPTAKPTSASPTYTVTQNPTAKPTTAVPTYTVTQNPTAVPTTASPSARPTAGPTNLPDEIMTGIFSSPTYKARCGTGFAAIFPESGAVATWGTLVRASLFPQSGGSTVAVTVAPGNGMEVTPGRAAFAAHLAGESITAWGATSVFADSMVDIQGLSLRFLIANDNAFAAVTMAGSVLAFGADFAGGNVVDDTKCNGFSAQLSANVAGIKSNSAAFAAIKDNGDVYAWGSKYTGGGVSTLTVPALSNIFDMAATRTAFAAITHDHAVIAWGDKMGGGDTAAVASQLTSNVMRVIGSQSVFVAFKYDGSLVVWGNSLHGADITAVSALLAGGVKYVTFNPEAMAALKTDGSVVTWGVAGSGGDSSSTTGLTSVVRIFNTKYAFAALTSTGGVVAWGDANAGGLIPSALVTALSSGVMTVYATDRAFAAHKSGSGGLVLWGNPHFGGDAGAAAPHLTSGVMTVCANDVAFTAMKDDGHAVVWGHSSSIPVAGLLDSAEDFTYAQCAQ